MPSKTELRKFRRKWCRYRKLPKLYHPSELKIAPDVQFLNEMFISLGSWSNKELDGLLGPNKHHDMVNKTEAARDLVERLFNGYSDTTLRYFIGEL